MRIEPDMAEPVLAVARFMAKGEEHGLANHFATGDEVVILENFPPFLFTGPGAFEDWRQGFIAHARMLDLDGLVFEIGHPQDLSIRDDRTYFTLPVRWRGNALGHPFDERGGWSFVLVREADERRWRILSYAWAVTSKAVG
jgi:hypothetical protein